MNLMHLKVQPQIGIFISFMHDSNISQHPKLIHFFLVLLISLRDRCTCWDNINNVIILQHNKIKASFKNRLHMVRHTFNVTKRSLGFISKLALIHIVEEFDRVKHVRFDSKRCSCCLRTKQGLQCAC